MVTGSFRAFLDTSRNAGQKSVSKQYWRVNSKLKFISLTAKVMVSPTSFGTFAHLDNPDNLDYNYHLDVIFPPISISKLMPSSD